MRANAFIGFTLSLLIFSGCIEPHSQINDSITPFPHQPGITETAPVPTPTPAPSKPPKSELLIDRISGNLTWFHERKWDTLYQADELDCSRMSTYFWDYIRKNFHVAPKIIVSYERQHAWLALKVSDVGNSNEYSRWHIRDTDYYFVEATIPRVVAEDNRKFLINGREYTSTAFYDVSIYVFDTPQDANDFHADVSSLGGWNQEFRLKADDLNKISKLLGG